MLSADIPKDLSKVKTKIAFNLTKRQIICFGCAAVIGLPVYFLLKQHLSLDISAILMIILMLPFFLLALFERNGMPCEKIIKNIVLAKFIRPKKRLYKTQNYYVYLNNKYKAEKALGGGAVVETRKSKSQKQTSNK